MLGTCYSENFLEGMSRTTKNLRQDKRISVLRFGFGTSRIRSKSGSY